MPERTMMFGATAGSTVFSGKALWDLIARVDWNSALTFLGSAAFTLLSYYVAARSKIAADRREQERLDREEARDQQWRDFLLEMRKANFRPESLAVEVATVAAAVPKPGPAIPPGLNPGS